jgi:hypothetical protein
LQGVVVSNTPETLYTMSAMQHDSDDDTVSWVERSRLLQSKKLAEERARALEEMEQSVQDAPAPKKSMASYSSSTLSVLKMVRSNRFSL